MKSLKSLALEVVRNAGVLVGTAVVRDQQTIADRFEHEGESFLTITLPAFCKGFERALADGRAVPALFHGFKWRRGLPCFLRGFLELVFDSSTGVLLDQPSVEAIRCIRQITLWSGKIFEVCDSDRVQASIDAYVEIETHMAVGPLPGDLSAELARTASKYFGDQLSRIDKVVYDGLLVGSHGPGATADRISGNQKFHIRRWTARLDEWFPVADHVVPSYGYFDEVSSVQWDEPGAEVPVKVTSVPKTAAKARIIAMEPLHMQFAQQGILREFAREFSGSAPFVNLRDQEPNQELARQGSVDGSVATIDLSEASDRVSLELVRSVFAHFPSLLGALEASRSLRAQLPDGTVMPLRKFASMGSATCFPVESIVFATIALVAGERVAGRTSLPCQRGSRWQDRTRVFGDDMIVPTDVVPTCLSLLSALGLKVNSHKSFWTGKFRESCGKEFYAGEDVTVARLRKRLPQDRRSAREIASLVAFRNHLYARGFWSVTWEIDKKLRTYGPLPIVDANSPILGRHSVCFTEVNQRWDSDLQIPLLRGMVITSRPPRSIADDLGSLMKCLSPVRREPFQDERHLERSGRPRAVYIKHGWFPRF
jgi:hypothetical protein